MQLSVQAAERFHGLDRYAATIPFSTVSARHSPRVLQLVARNGHPTFMIGHDLVLATIRRGWLRS
jgi:hypothetical protein